MDLEAIERALEKCIEREDICHDQNTPSHDDMITAMALWTDAAEVLAMHHGPDLLRLVRAMRWLSANADMLSRPCSGSRWNVGVIGTLDSFTGDNPIAAIEAAMNNQPRAT